MDDIHAQPQNTTNDLYHHSSPHDWTFGQDFHLSIGVSNTWNLATVHIEGKQSYSPGMLHDHFVFFHFKNFFSSKH